MPSTSAHPRWNRPAAWIMAIVAVTLGGIYVVNEWTPRQPASVRILPDGLSVLDNRGNELWRRIFGTLNMKSYHLGERLSWVGDLDGDGRLEVLFIPAVAANPPTSFPLICFDSVGRELWRYVPTRTLVKRDRVIHPLYKVRQFAVVRNKIVVSSHHHLYYPGVITLLSAKGQAEREYWHPGHLHALAIGKRHGRSIVYAGGINNFRSAATLVALDLERFAGAAVENGSPYFQGMAPGVELARLTFPRTVLNQAYPYNHVVSIAPEGDGVHADIREQLDLPTAGSIQYHLDENFNLRSVSLSDWYVMEHRRFTKAPLPTEVQLRPIRID